jgi:membrane-associated phospholipid phosphatase
MKKFDSLDAHWSSKLILPIHAPQWTVAAQIAHLGDGLLVFGGMALAYWWGWQFKIPLLEKVVFVSLMNLLITAWIVFGIKYTVKRQRPRNPSGFASIRYDKYSFPSGHAARLSCLAMTILPYNRTLGLALGLLALVVAAARVAIGVHYLSDVLVGLVVGVLVAVIISTYVIRG